MSHWQTIALLIGANFVADVAAVRIGAGKNFPHPALVVGYAFLFAQVSLGAIWIGVGSSTIALRLAAHLVVFAGVYVGLSALHDNHGQWLSLLAVQTVAVAGPLAVGRWYGLRLQMAGTTGHEQPWQFTLKHVFVVTTACAVLLGLFRLAPPSLDLGNRTFEAFLLGAGFALMALVAAWVALGHGRRLFKLLVMPVVTFLVGGLLIAIDGHGSRANDVAVMAIVFGQMLFLTLPLAVLRRHGYRLVRR